MVLLSITPLPDGVLQLDIIAPFHTSGPPLLQFHLDIEQWGINTGGAVQTSTLPITFTNVFLAVASTSTEWCCPGCSATNTAVTTRAYQSNRPDVAQPNDVNWIVIGC